MIVLHKVLPVQNSCILVRDILNDEPLFIERDSAVAIGQYGLNISCLPDSEGDTSVVAGSVTEIKPDVSLVFDGVIKTPSKKLLVETILRTPIFEIDVDSALTKLSVWTDGHPGTGRIVIGIG
ncbi:MAG: hypothetical protein KGZ73_11225 [Rhizobiales bacterium]|jgi:hypothetical protein|nr:hypothetical protein [Hyphomicrobiales bacterium]